MREASRYAFLFDDLYAVSLCGTFFSVMHFIALWCWCLREASRKERGAKKCFLSCSVQHSFRELVFQKIESSRVFLLQRISGIGNKKSWFSQKRTSFSWK